MQFDLASFDNLQNSWFLLVFLAHKLFYNKLFHECIYANTRDTIDNNDDNITLH